MPRQRQSEILQRTDERKNENWRDIEDKQFNGLEKDDKGFLFVR